MQVFKAFFKVQKRYMIPAIMFTLMGVLMLIMNYAMAHRSTSDNGFQSMSLPIYLTDEDQSEVSSLLADYLRRTHKVDEAECSDEMLTERLYYQDLAAAITIPKGFGQAFTDKNTGDRMEIRSVVDEGLAEGHMLNLQLKSFLNSMYAFYHSGMSLTEAAAQAEQTQASDNYVSLVREATEEGTVNERSGESTSRLLFIFIPYVIMCSVFGSLLPAVMSFGESEKKRRENASGFAVWKRSFALAFGSLVFALAFCLIYVVILAFVCGSETFSEMWWLMALNLLIFTFSTVMMMAFLSVIPLKASVLSSIVSTVVSLGFAFLGGLFVPMQYLGEGVKMIGRFLPTYWYATAVEALDKGKGFASVLPYFGIELLFGLACLAIGLALSKASERAG